MEYSGGLMYVSTSSANTVSFGGGGGTSAGYCLQPAPPAPVAQSPLDWLDSEIERTCRLARLK